MVRENTRVAVSENCFFKESLEKGGRSGVFLFVSSLRVFKINPKNNMNAKKKKNKARASGGGTQCPLAAAAGQYSLALCESAGGLLGILQSRNPPGALPSPRCTSPARPAGNKRRNLHAPSRRMRVSPEVLFPNVMVTGLHKEECGTAEGAISFSTHLCW